MKYKNKPFAPRLDKWLFANPGAVENVEQARAHIPDAGELDVFRQVKTEAKQLEEAKQKTNKQKKKKQKAKNEKARGRPRKSQDEDKEKPKGPEDETAKEAGTQDTNNPLVIDEDDLEETVNMDHY